jgi:RNA polymerase sigma-70 factor, ECF subfamily
VIDKLRSGDPLALRQMIEQYQPMVLRTAKGFVKNTEDARDVTQEVFIDIITHINKFSGKSSLSTWIYRITVNRSLNFLRNNKKRKNHTSGERQDENGTDPVMQLTDPTQKSPQELLEQQDRARSLHKALNSLPEKQQIAFTLAEYDDLSYKEIAEVMQTSVSSVESLIFRARRKLQEKLWKEYRGG